MLPWHRPPPPPPVPPLQSQAPPPPHPPPPPPRLPARATSLDPTPSTEVPQPPLQRPASGPTRPVEGSSEEAASTPSRAAQGEEENATDLDLDALKREIFGEDASSRPKRVRVEDPAVLGLAENVSSRLEHHCALKLRTLNIRYRKNNDRSSTSA